MGSIRLKKLAEALKREISKIILYELKDPGIGFVTVTKAEPSVDSRTAKVYVSILGGEEKKKKTLNTLERARGHIQSLLGKHLEIRHTPILSFCLDDTANRGIHLSKLIEEITKEEEDVGCQG